MHAEYPLDPGETHNLTTDPRYNNVLFELQSRLRKWMEETADPLLNGPVPLPSGAYANKQSCISPAEDTYDRNPR